MKKKLILKLIETNDTPKVGDLVIIKTLNHQQLTSIILSTVTKITSGGFIYTEYCKESGLNRAWIKVVKPYGISDEEIKEGDTYLSIFTNDVRVATKDDEIIHANTLKNSSYNTWFKVEILPEQFNYQDIVDLGLKDGDEIAFEEVYGMQDTYRLARYKESKPSQVYSEEEVYSKLKNISGDILFAYKMNKVKYEPADVVNFVIDWFNQNKKK